MAGLARRAWRVTMPYARRSYRGVTLDNRTISALEWAEARYLAKAPRKRQPWRLGQGSYSHGSLSGSTHAKGGAVDVMFAGLNAKQRRAVVRCARRAGFAAWGRTDDAVWGSNNDHAHMILLGHRTASAAAKQQMAAYLAGRDGLVSNLIDKAWRPKRRRRWSHRQRRPVVAP